LASIEDPYANVLKQIIDRITIGTEVRLYLTAQRRFNRRDKCPKQSLVARV